MAPQEVAGLQALAKAHGGSLTVNPDTGLAEAGFLSSILPLAVGAFLGPAGFGLTAMQAGLAAGAVGTLATGSLSKGLMAGLGAYGGAGLAGSLMGAGAGAAQNAAMAAVPQGAGAGLTSGMELAALENPAVAGFQTANTGAASSALGATAANPTGIPGFSGTGLGLTPPSAVSAQQAVLQAAPQTFTPAPELTHQGMLNEAAARVTPGTELYKAAGTSPFDTAKAGFGEVMKRPGDFMTKENLKYGLMGLAPVAMDMLTPKQREIAEKEKLKPYEYEFSLNPTGAASGYRPIGSPSGYDSSEMQHFDPRFVRKAAGGGLMDIGPIEAMSNRNQAETLMANGGQMFAEGGETKAVKPVEQDPYYTMTGQSGDVFKYLMGQGSAPTAPVRAVPVAVAPEQAAVQAAPAPAKTGLSGLSGRLFAGLGQTPSSENQGAGGYYEDDTSGRRDYTFDPNLGGFRAAPVPKRFVPYEADTTTAMPGLSYENMNGGMANGGIASLAQGGVSHLGDYSDGGRLLKGPGDGVSDSIPASIGDKRPARLADGEFVVRFPLGSPLVFSRRYIKTSGLITLFLLVSWSLSLFHILSSLCWRNISCSLNLESFLAMLSPRLLNFLRIIGGAYPHSSCPLCC
jgi:hypothetical protein